MCWAGALTKQLSDLPLSKTCVAHLFDIVIEHTRVPQLGVTQKQSAQAYVPIGGSVMGNRGIPRHARVFCARPKCHHGQTPSCGEIKTSLLMRGSMERYLGVTPAHHAKQAPSSVRPRKSCESLAHRFGSETMRQLKKMSRETPAT